LHKVKRVNGNQPSRDRRTDEIFPSIRRIFYTQATFSYTGCKRYGTYPMKNKHADHHSNFQNLLCLKHAPFLFTRNFIRKEESLETYLVMQALLISRVCLQKCEAAVAFDNLMFKGFSCVKVLHKFWFVKKRDSGHGVSFFKTEGGWVFNNLHHLLFS